MIRTIARTLAVTFAVLAAAVSLAGTAGASAARPVHAGPYTYTPAVTMPAHGYGTDLVTFHGSLCRGRTAYASILAVTDAGGEEAEPGTIRADHLSFSLQFDRGDAGRWSITGVSVGCADGSNGQYNGDHAVITVR